MVQVNTRSTTCTLILVWSLSTSTERPNPDILCGVPLAVCGWQMLSVILTIVPLLVLISGEESKYGVDPGDTLPLCQHVHQECHSLRFAGLMTIGMADYTSRPENFQVSASPLAVSICPLLCNASVLRRCTCTGSLVYLQYSLALCTKPREPCVLSWVQALADLREEVCKELGMPLTDVELSMGMSGDFEQAVRPCWDHMGLPCLTHRTRDLQLGSLRSHAFAIAG